MLVQAVLIRTSARQLRRVLTQVCMILYRTDSNLIDMAFSAALQGLSEPNKAARSVLPGFLHLRHAFSPCCVASGPSHSDFRHCLITNSTFHIVHTDLPQIMERLGDIRHKILVLSGKGGVGKSTVSSQLAFALAMSDNPQDAEEPYSDRQIGLLDIDICGPSIPRIMGLEGQGLHPSNTGWEPVSVQPNLSVTSVGFLLNDTSQAMIWRGPNKNGLIKQFVRDVDWGTLDYLIIDTPPGTTDEHLSITSYLKPAGITGAIIVTTPQEVALSDVRKEINFCKKVGIPILGVVENMSGFVCRKCGTETKIFFPTTGGAQRMCQELQVRFLGAIPIDPLIARNCDEGKSFIAQCPDSPAAQVYQSIFKQIVALVEAPAN